MTGPIVYVDTADVREGALEEVKMAIAELVEFVNENEPWLPAYAISLDEAGTEMTVIHVHAEAATLERHLEVGAPAFEKLAPHVTLTSIKVYGEVPESTVEMLHAKARRLGHDNVEVQPPEAAMSRLRTP